MRSKRLFEYDDNCPACERTCCTVIIGSGAESPNKVTRALGIEPSRTRERGSVRIGPSGTSSGIPAKHNVWILQSEYNVESKDLRRHLDWLLDRLESAIDGLNTVRKWDGASVFVDCVWWAGLGGGPILWPEQMARLAALELEVAFSFADYNAYDDESEDNTCDDESGDC